MAVMLNCGAVFLHIPKTGGSWVTDILRSQGLVRKEFTHIHADMVRVRYYNSGTASAVRSSYEWAKSLVPRKLKALGPAQRLKKSAEQACESSLPFYFCFVRHPLRWYESWWRYMCGRSGADWASESDLTSWHPCGILRELGDPEFATFVRNVNRVRPGFVTELYGLYTQQGIQFVGQQERLVDDLVDVLKKLNVNFDEQQIRESKRVNVSKTERLPIEWAPDLEFQTTQFELAGMARYGYEPSAIRENSH
jgi:hypothetical protein